MLQVDSCFFIFLHCNNARALKLHAALLENDTTHDIAAEALGDAAALKMLRCHGAYVVDVSLDNDVFCSNAHDAITCPSHSFPLLSAVQSEKQNVESSGVRSKWLHARALLMIVAAFCR